MILTLQLLNLMRVSFHYGLPNKDNNRISSFQGFTTPKKVKKLYGSTNTAQTETQNTQLYPFRLHRLLPSRSPLTNKCTNKQAKVCSPYFQWSKTKVTFSYEVDLGTSNLQQQIKQLKKVLSAAISQENALQVQRSDNLQQYEHLLKAIEQDCSIMAGKAAFLKSGIVDLEISFEQVKQ